MSSSTVYGQLADLYSCTFAVLERVRSRASSEEVKRAVKDARRSLERLDDLVQPVALKSDLDRHLHFIAYFYARDEHQKYEADLVDIPTRDIPAIAERVEQWQRRQFDPELLQAIDGSWRSGNFRAVVRDAFVHLERRLRRMGGVPDTSGLSGDRLVNQVLGLSSPSRTGLPSGHSLAPITRGEEEGAFHLLKGNLLLWRNPSAHKPIEYTPEEAEALVRQVDICLRLIDPLGRP